MVKEIYTMCKHYDHRKTEIIAGGFANRKKSTRNYSTTKIHGINLVTHNIASINDHDNLKSYFIWLCIEGCYVIGIKCCSVTRYLQFDCFILLGILQRILYCNVAVTVLYQAVRFIVVVIKIHIIAAKPDYLVLLQPKAFCL